MPEQPSPPRTSARQSRTGAARLIAAAVAAHVILLLWAVPALAQTSGPTSSMPAGQGDRMNGPFIVVAVIAGLLLVLFQRRTFRKMQDMFDPDRDRPAPPDEPGRPPLP